MTDKAFIQMVKKMRYAQMAYKRTFSQRMKEEAGLLEKLVDQAIERFEEEQKNLDEERQMKFDFTGGEDA